MFLNNSGAEEFEDCARKRFWSKEFNGTGLQSIYRNDNLDFGTIVHAGLAAYYSGEAFPTIKARDAAKELLDWDNLYFEDRNQWSENMEWIDRIIHTYQPWAQANDDFTPFQIESEGCVVLGEICYSCGNPYEVPENPEELRLCKKCGVEINHWVYRIDLAVNKGEHNPKINIIDHKTTGSVGENYLLQWHNSLQLWGYCYGFEKQTGMEVSGYIVNIIRKIKGIGREDNTEKACSLCRNGVRKRIGCVACQGSGKVLKEKKQEDIPFLREYEGWDEHKKEIFVRQRIGTIDRIQLEQERFKLVSPDEAWPMNPKSCFKMGRCPFWKLCYQPNDPEKWYLPTDEQLTNFTERTPDYVSVKQLAREEMV